MAPLPDARPGPAATSIPRPTPLGKEAFAPTVAPPTWKQVQPLVKVPGLRVPVASSTLVALGGQRFAAVARMTERTTGAKDPETGVQPGDYALILVIVEPDGAGWKVVQQLRVWDYAVADPCQSDSAPVRVTAGDLDHDGRPELELRIPLAKSERAVGCVKRSHLALVDLHPAPRITLVDNLDARGVYRTISTLRYVDLSGDGFPDVHITETTRRDPDDGLTKYPNGDRRYLYDPTRDGYLSRGKLLRYGRTPRWTDPNEP